MSRLKALSIWLVGNTVFGAALYFGLVKGVDGAVNIVQFYIWFHLILSLLTLSDDVIQAVRKNGSPSVPKWMNAAFDLCTIAMLVWYGWAWTAGAYTLSAILFSRIRVRTPSDKD